MAKSKAEGSDYKAGGSKKWLFIVGILVLIAIIVVIIVVSIPGNSYGAIERLSQASQSSFLQSEREKALYDNTERKISESLVTDDYLQELQDIRLLSTHINYVLDYYNGYMIYASDNSVLRRNHKTIENSLEDALTYQDQMDELLTDINGLGENSDSYLRVLWIDFRAAYTNYLSNMSTAIDALNNCYQGCFDKTFTNNLASQIILNTIDDYLTEITKDFGVIVENDRENFSERDYNYQSHGKVDYFCNFVEAYILDDSDIKGYYFNDSLIQNYELINKFYNLYNQTNFELIISSIDNSGTITLSFQQEDSEGVYQAVKEFLSVR